MPNGQFDGRRWANLARMLFQNVPAQTIIDQINRCRSYISSSGRYSKDAAAGTLASTHQIFMIASRHWALQITLFETRESSYDSATIGEYRSTSPTLGNHEIFPNLKNAPCDMLDASYSDGQFVIGRAEMRRPWNLKHGYDQDCREKSITFNSRNILTNLFLEQVFWNFELKCVNEGSSRLRRWKIEMSQMLLFVVLASLSYAVIIRARFDSISRRILSVLPMLLTSEQLASISHESQISDSLSHMELRPHFVYIFSHLVIAFIWVALKLAFWSK
jgi:hypothetical protein